MSVAFAGPGRRTFGVVVFRQRAERFVPRAQSIGSFKADDSTRHRNPRATVRRKY